MTPYYTQLYTKYRVDSARLAISADTDWGLMQASAYGNWLRASAVAPSNFVQAFEIYNPVVVAQLQDVIKFGVNHVVRLSVEYRHNSMGTTPIIGGTVFYDVFSGSAMWQWRIIPDLTFTNALRIDSLSLGRSGRFPPGIGLDNAEWSQGSRDEISFNSGLVWSADELNTVRLTAARGVQLPSLIDLGGLLEVSPVFGASAGVPFVKPSIVGNYELAWDAAFPAWDVRMKLRAFYQTTDDLIADTGTPYPARGIIFGAGNIGRSDADGLELILSQAVDEHWHWDIGYRAEVIHDHFSPGYSLQNTLRDFADASTRPCHQCASGMGARFLGGRRICPLRIGLRQHHDPSHAGRRQADPRARARIGRWPRRLSCYRHSDAGGLGAKSVRFTSAANLGARSRAPRLSHRQCRLLSISSRPMRVMRPVGARTLKRRMGGGDSPSPCGVRMRSGSERGEIRGDAAHLLVGHVLHIAMHDGIVARVAAERLELRHQILAVLAGKAWRERGSGGCRSMAGAACGHALESMPCLKMVSPAAIWVGSSPVAPFGGCWAEKYAATSFISLSDSGPAMFHMNAFAS